MITDIFAMLFILSIPVALYAVGVHIAKKHGDMESDQGMAGFIVAAVGCGLIIAAVKFFYFVAEHDSVSEEPKTCSTSVVGKKDTVYFHDTLVVIKETK